MSRKMERGEPRSMLALCVASMILFCMTGCPDAVQWRGTPVVDGGVGGDPAQNSADGGLPLEDAPAVPVTVDGYQPVHANTCRMSLPPLDRFEFNPDLWREVHPVPRPCPAQNPGCALGEVEGGSLWEYRVNRQPAVVRVDIDIPGQVWGNRQHSLTIPLVTSSLGAYLNAPESLRQGLLIDMRTFTVGTATAQGSLSPSTTIMQDGCATEIVFPDRAGAVAPEPGHLYFIGSLPDGQPHDYLVYQSPHPVIPPFGVQPIQEDDQRPDSLFYWRGRATAQCNVMCVQQLRVYVPAIPVAIHGDPLMPESAAEEEEEAEVPDQAWQNEEFR